MHLVRDVLVDYSTYLNAYSESLHRLEYIWSTNAKGESQVSQPPWVRADQPEMPIDYTRMLASCQLKRGVSNKNNDVDRQDSKKGSKYLDDT